MKYLKDYTSEAITKLLDDNEAFFAFSDKQFEETRNKNISDKDYCNLFAGIVAPKKNVDAIIEGLKRITTEGRKKDIKENGIIKIIERELRNYECYYTGDYQDAMEGLKGYGITIEQVKKIYIKNKNKY